MTGPIRKESGGKGRVKFPRVKPNHLSHPTLQIKTLSIKGVEISLYYLGLRILLVYVLRILLGDT